MRRQVGASKALNGCCFAYMIRSHISADLGYGPIGSLRHYITSIVSGDGNEVGLVYDELVRNNDNKRNYHQSVLLSNEATTYFTMAISLGLCPHYSLHLVGPMMRQHRRKKSSVKFSTSFYRTESKQGIEQLPGKSNNQLRPLLDKSSLIWKRIFLPWSALLSLASFQHQE